MNVEKYTDVNVGVDLVSAAHNHVEFLKTVDQHPGLYEGPALHRAIWRYTQLWLPLVTQHRFQVLSAPLDIEWVWHCHMLYPVQYQRDCERLYQHTPDHSVLDSCNYQRALNISENLWKQMYPDQLFMVDLIDETWQGPVSHDLSYDLESAAGRQRVFYYQVSFPHYLDEKFLKNGFTALPEILVFEKEESWCVSCTLL